MPVILKKGRGKSLLRRHPWIFSGAIHHADDPSSLPARPWTCSRSMDSSSPAPAYSPQSQIRARVWTFEDEPIDKEFFRGRSGKQWPRGIRIAYRTQIQVRLIYAELDQLPGLIVDRYGDVLGLAIPNSRYRILERDPRRSPPRRDRFRHHLRTLRRRRRELEGLEAKVGLLRGTPSSISPITVYENNLKFNVNLKPDIKPASISTSAETVCSVRELAKDKDVLDCFCYTGGFTVNALGRWSEVRSVR